MKKVSIICLCVLFTSITIAQTKKAPMKKPAPKAVAQPVQEQTSRLTSSTAGKFAKDFSNRIYNTDPVYGDKKRGLNLNIHGWEPLKNDDGTVYYIIKMDLSWEEGTGGIGDWRKISYKGSLIADEFGCNALYLITEKKEPSILGLLKRARNLTTEQIEFLSSMHQWLTGINCFWEPSGCLNE
jgi:hypothetical protein